MSQHNAPSVIYPLGHSRWRAGVFLGLWLAGVLLIAAWISASQQFGWEQLAGIATVVGAGLVVFRGWKNSPVGQLEWDGQVWHWIGPGYQAGVAEYDLLAVVDFKHVMLLCFENQAHAKLWLWAERLAFPARWLDLRRAAYLPHRGPLGVVNP